MKTIQVKLLSGHGKMPTRAHATDAGLDIYASDDYDSFDIEPGDREIVDTDIAVLVPSGYVGLIRDRSSISIAGLKVTAGVVDAGFTGHMRVVLINTSTGLLKVHPGQKIAQLLIIPIETPIVEVVTEFVDTERGDKGWGSSGAV